MSGTTARGWPYVQAADYPKVYPALSLDLANKLEARLGVTYWCNLHRATTVTVASGATYDVVWETQGTDADHPVFAWTSAGVVIPATGIYSARFLVDNTGVAAGRVALQIIRNGTNVDYGDRWYNPAAKALLNSTSLPALNCNGGDVVSGRILAYEQQTVTASIRLTIAGPFAGVA